AGAAVRLALADLLEEAEHADGLVVVALDGHGAHGRARRHDRRALRRHPSGRGADLLGHALGGVRIDHLDLHDVRPFLAGLPNTFAGSTGVPGVRSGRAWAACSRATWRRSRWRAGVGSPFATPSTMCASTMRRAVNTSRASCAEGCATYAPRFGRSSTDLSWASRKRILRTRARLTAKSDERDSSPSLVPGGSRCSRMARWMRS